MVKVWVNVWHAPYDDRYYFSLSYATKEEALRHTLRAFSRYITTIQIQFDATEIQKRK